MSEHFSQVITLEQRSDVLFHVVCPDISVGSLKEDAEAELSLNLIGSVDRFSNTNWESNCRVELVCIDTIETVNRHMQLVATARLFKARNTSGVIVVFQRIFSHCTDAQDWSAYIPTETYAKVLELYYQTSIVRGENMFFFHQPDLSSALIGWVLCLETPATVPVRDILDHARQHIQDIEQILAARMTYIDAHHPNATEALRKGRQLTSLELDLLRSGYGITIDEHVSSGGVATVWRGKDRYGKSIALKLLAPDLRFSQHELLSQRFQKEYAIARTLRELEVSPKTHEFGEVLGRSFFTQDLLPYPDMRVWLRTHRSNQEKLTIIRSFLNAVLTIHAHGVIHRDIAPKNILISEEKVFLIDFGAATEIDPEMCFDITQPIHRFGSLKYTAPELRDNGRAGSALSDWYSAAIIVYEVFLERNICGNLPRLQVLVPDVPTDISEFAYRAISFSASERQPWSLFGVSG